MLVKWKKSDGNKFNLKEIENMRTSTAIIR